MKQPSRTLIPLVLAGFVALSGTLPAAGAPATPDPQALFAQLQSRLALTPEQQAALKPIVEQHVASLKSIRGQYGAEPSRRDKRAMLKAMKAERQGYEEKVAGVLDPPQEEEWKKLQQELRAKAKDRYEARGE